MTASGMIVVNPPWTLAGEMQEILPWLAEVLGIEDAGFYRIDILAEE
jgi:23S rRNA (adenine2030-N6)-methyltransferase